MNAAERAAWDELIAEHAIPDVSASPIGCDAWQHVHADGRIVVARVRPRVPVPPAPPAPPARPGAGRAGPPAPAICTM